jgi:hypothetical protein
MDRIASAPSGQAFARSQPLGAVQTLRELRRIAPDLSSRARLVYIALLDRTAMRDGIARPSYATLAEDVGGSVSSARAAVLELERAHVIRREKRSDPSKPDGKTQLANAYVILWWPAAGKGRGRQPAEPGVGSRQAPSENTQSRDLPTSSKRVDSKLVEEARAQYQPMVFAGLVHAATSSQVPRAIVDQALRRTLDAQGIRSPEAFFRAECRKLAEALKHAPPPPVPKPRVELPAPSYAPRDRPGIASTRSDAKQVDREYVEGIELLLAAAGKRVAA